MKDMMLTQMMGMFGSMLPKSKPPANPVAQFLADEIKKMYPERNEVVGMIEGIVVGMGNDDPNGTMRVLVTLHNDIAALVNTLQETGDGTPDSE
jgi:hypothetical protein